MLSVLEAKKTLDQAVKSWRGESCPRERLSLDQALGRVLVHDVEAPIALPPFDNSAMDGFAIRAVDIDGACADKPVLLHVAGDACAGDPPCILSEGKAIRIMTGAVIPQGADTVFAKEDVCVTAETVAFTHVEKVGRHIRRTGEDMTKGACALTAGTRLTPAALSFLTSLGVSHVNLAVRPRVSILATGHELMALGNTLLPGKIFDSNTAFLTTSLASLEITPHRVKRLDDHYPLIRHAVETALADSDVVIVSGGVSVGEYDHTRSVLASLGVEELFWKVSQKPGKPLLAGTYKNGIVLGLPGNPYAVAMCFYVYIRPLLLQMMGARDCELRRYRLPLATSATNMRGRTTYLKGKILHETHGLRVIPLSGQGSHLMRAFLEADCLIECSEDQEKIAAGDLVTVMQLP